jgi:hypothetical protein
LFFMAKEGSMGSPHPARMLLRPRKTAHITLRITLKTPQLTRAFKEE